MYSTKNFLVGTGNSSWGILQAVTGWIFTQREQQLSYSTLNALGINAC
jgi:hypothetical protein